MICWTKEPAVGADGTISAETALTEGDAWFEGHFPGQPLLPAVAQLSLAWEAVRLVAGPDVRLAGFRRVKFKEMILPGRRLTLTATVKNSSGKMFWFRIDCDGKLACSGTLLLSPNRQGG